VREAAGVTASAVKDMTFHWRQGCNMSVSSDGLTASVMHASHDSGAAVVTSCRPLRDNEMFEIRVDRVIESWSASLEAGTCYAAVVMHHDCISHKLFRLTLAMNCVDLLFFALLALYVVFGKK